MKEKNRKNCFCTIPAKNLQKNFCVGYRTNSFQKNKPIKKTFLRNFPRREKRGRGKLKLLRSRIL